MSYLIMFRVKALTELVTRAKTTTKTKKTFDTISTKNSFLTNYFFLLCVALSLQFSFCQPDEKKITRRSETNLLHARCCRLLAVSPLPNLT